MTNEQIKEMIANEIESLDAEIRDGLFEAWVEPNNNAIRLDESGLAYQGDDKDAYVVAQVENGEIINWL
ncbi:hypothetical protein ACW66K_05830 [Aerococcus urinaeequi]